MLQPAVKDMEGRKRGQRMFRWEQLQMVDALQMWKRNRTAGNGIGMKNGIIPADSNSSDASSRDVSGAWNSTACKAANE